MRGAMMTPMGAPKLATYEDLRAFVDAGDDLGAELGQVGHISAQFMQDLSERRTLRIPRYRFRRKLHSRP